MFFSHIYRIILFQIAYKKIILSFFVMSWRKVNDSSLCQKFIISSSNYETTIMSLGEKSRKVSEFSLPSSIAYSHSLYFLSYFDNFFHRISFRFIWQDDLFSRPPHKVSIRRCLNGWQATRPYCRLNYYLTPESYNGQQGVLESSGTFQPDGQITVEIKFLIPVIFQVMLPIHHFNFLAVTLRELWPHLNRS